MATVIQIKRSSATSAPGTLKQGELAYAYGTGTQVNNGDRMFIGTGPVDLNGDATSIDIIGGKYFTALLDHVHGELTPSSAIITDNNSAIDELNIGNQSSTAGILRFNEATNNGTSFIALKAPNDVTTSTTFTLPNGDDTAGQFLKTDGSGVLSFGTVNQFINLDGDVGTDVYNTAETLTFTGGTGLDTEVTNNEITINITNSGVDTAQIKDDAVTNAKLSTNGEFTLGSTGMQLGGTTTDIAGLTSLVVDDITVNGQSIVTTASNKDIELAPHGTGVVNVPSGYENRAGLNDNSLVNKRYVDAVAEGLHVHEQCHAILTTPLATITGDTVTYNNGTSGIGATLTLSTALDIAGGDLDGDTDIVVGDRIIVNGETNKAHNGIYVITSTTVLTRALDFDTPTEAAGGDFVFITHGTTYNNSGWVLAEGVGTIGTDPFDFVQFSGLGQVTAGDALSKTGNTLNVEVDNSSIEVFADALRVKALGITDAMLAGSISSNKLADPLYFTDESSTQGSVPLGGTLEFLAGEGINTIASGRTIQIVGELASTSNIGVASFTSDNFSVTTGEVAVTQIDGGTY